MKRVINDFHCGEADDRVAELSCGYDQNVGSRGRSWPAPNVALCSRTAFTERTANGT